MLKIFFIILELNYTLIIGYMPCNSIHIYEAEYMKESYEFFSVLEAEILINDLFFIGGKTETLFHAKEINNYIPYCVDFSFNAGLRYKLFEIGFIHRCIHPIFTYSIERQPVKYEGGFEKIYFKFSNTIK